MLTRLSYNTLNLESSGERPFNNTPTMKTRESVAKSPQAVNEKNTSQAWGNAYSALLQFKETPA